jgi:hypothetical protein
MLINSFESSRLYDCEEQNEQFCAEYKHAYRDFFKYIESLGRVSPSETYLNKSHSPARSEVTKPLQALRGLASLFERFSFQLYARLLRARKESLVAAQLSGPIIVRRLAEDAELVFHEIYIARLEEFAERAGFCGNRTLPDFYLLLIPMNARGHTSKLFRELENEILAVEESGRTPQLVDFDEEAKANSGQHVSVEQPEHAKLPAVVNPISIVAMTEAQSPVHTSGCALEIAPQRARLGEINASLSRKKRGRPTTISDDKKQKALSVQGGKARAQILYGVSYPTSQQVKNVSSILRHYIRKRDQS